MKSKTILVVDDDVDILKLLSKILTGAGHDVLIADSPEAARAILAKTPPNIIMSDLHMQPEDGFSFIQWCKSEKKFQAIPIIVLSALNDFHSVKKAVALGVEDYALKPIQTPILLRKLKKIMFHHDFAKWTPSVSERPGVSVSTVAKISALGETGCTITGPFKLDPSSGVEANIPAFSEAGLDDLTLQSTTDLKRYLAGGLFENDVTFVGISENVTSKLRVLMKKGARP